MDYTDFFIIETLYARHESIQYKFTTKYRFKSLYNSCVGTRCFHKKDAIEQGEAHAKLLILVHKLPVEFDAVSYIEGD